MVETREQMTKDKEEGHVGCCWIRSAAGTASSPFLATLLLSILLLLLLQMTLWAALPVTLLWVLLWVYLVELRERLPAGLLAERRPH